MSYAQQIAALAEFCEKRSYIGAGMIISRTDPDATRILCLKGTGTNKWSFPKGKRETWDNDIPINTAMRETEEETGLLAGVDYTVTAPPVRHGKYLYSLCQMTQSGSLKTLVLSDREHCQADWFTAEELLHLNGNRDMGIWAKKAMMHLVTHQSAVGDLTLSDASTQPMHSYSLDYSASSSA